MCDTLNGEITKNRIGQLNPRIIIRTHTNSLHDSLFGYWYGFFIMKDVNHYRSWKRNSRKITIEVKRINTNG